MRKKELEKDIPNLDEYNFSNKAMIYAVVVRKTEKLLILDFLMKKTKKSVKKVVLEKTNYATYTPGNDSWNQRSLENNIFNNQSNYALSERTCEILPEHIEIIKSFDNWNYHDISWWELIERFQQNIRNRKTDKNDERRRKRLHERMEAVGDQEPEGMADWLRYQCEKYLFYKKKGRYVTCKCAECGDTFTYAWKRSGSYEGQFESIIDNPQAGKIIECPHCKTHVTCKPTGKVSNIEENKFGYAFGKYKETGIVLRYFNFCKKSYPDEGIGTYGAFTEIARIFFHKDEKIQTDFHKHNPYTGNDFWDDCNIYGMCSIKIEKGSIYRPSETELKGTIMEYSAYREYMNANWDAHIVGYLRKYYKHPEIEMLMKLGLSDMVENIGSASEYMDLTKKKIDQILRIRKDKLELLRKNHGKLSTYRILVAEKEAGLNLTENQIKFITDASISSDKLARIAQCMSVEKFINRSYRYAEIDRDANMSMYCSHGANGLYRTASTYADTLNMLFEVGEDTTKYTNLFPKDLRQKHNDLALILNERANEKVCEERNVKFCKIGEQFEDLCKIYAYEKGDLFIRPAYMASEIVKEGQTLHHCVGGESYLKRHHDGESFILMLRKKESPEEPYVTVEVRDDHISQWYGLKDKKVDQKQNQAWLDGWIKWVKNNKQMQKTILAAG